MSLEPAEKVLRIAALSMALKLKESAREATIVRKDDKVLAASIIQALLTTVSKYDNEKYLEGADDEYPR